MKIAAGIFGGAAILAICLVGFFAAVLGCRRLDDWCARQLSDPDGKELVRQ